jgi:hypothetical protein
MNDETWQKLMEARENDASLNARWPVFIIRKSGNGSVETNTEEEEDLADEEPNEAETVLPVKKSINID